MGLYSSTIVPLFSVGDVVLVDSMKVKLNMEHIVRRYKPRGFGYRYGWIPPDNSFGTIVNLGEYYYGHSRLYWYGVVVEENYYVIDEWGLTKVNPLI